MSDDDAKGQLLMDGMPPVPMDEDDAKAVLQQLLTFDGPISKLKGACLKLRDLHQEAAAADIEKLLHLIERVLCDEHVEAWKYAYGPKAPTNSPETVPEADELHNKAQD